MHVSLYPWFCRLFICFSHVYNHMLILACMCFIKPDVPSLRDFNNHVNPKISTKWYELGIQLRIKDYTLDEIRHNNPNDARTCCREAIKHWIHNADTASWNALIQALEADSISQKTLAKEVREKLLSGKFYLSAVQGKKVAYVCVFLL